MEHTVDPVQFIESAMDRYRCRTFICSTLTYPEASKPSPDWWYLSPITGQHISLFHMRTLAKLAERLSLDFHSSNGLHIFTEQPLSKRWLLPLLTSRASLPIAHSIRRIQGSLTWADHKILSNELGSSRRARRLDEVVRGEPSETSQ